MRGKTPSTRVEWQEATDAAVFSLGLDAAWKYGLILPDPKVDVERCVEIIDLAPGHGAVLHSLDFLLNPRVSVVKDDRG